jgi:putative ubiquitin-RnfH superfamily antitoxin RatB of RatAB toxin-antitoxin module
MTDTPAFPVVYHMSTPAGLVTMDVAPGLTVRDVAALVALQGLCADYSINATPKDLAAGAFEIADAFIAAREAGTNGA